MSLNIVVDKVPYLIRVEPFDFNGDTRFYIKINDGESHVFTWDSELHELRAIDDEASVLPVALEEQINQELQALIS